LYLQDGILSAPIWQGENKFGIIVFQGLPKRDIRTEDKYFISGLLNSLAFVLENLRQERRKKLALIGQMASGIIHDLKTPLTVIQGYAQLMLDCGTKMEIPERRDSLKFITDQANTMVRMVNDILDFARGDIDLQIEDYLIKAYIESLIESLQPLLEDKNIQLDSQFDYKGKVRFDVKRFQRVLLNIMKNAIEAVGVGDKIRLHVWKQEDTISIAIVNNGPKIPPEIQKTLFNPFVTHGKIGGTGLGMAIAKKIVEEHGGDITFTSHEAETKFIITLPQ
jgi:signal transduction histidine kinase